MRPSRGCLLFGTDLQWRKTDRVATGLRQPQHPLCSAGMDGYGGAGDIHE
jgi:hypothetical protein